MHAKQASKKDMLPKIPKFRNKPIKIPPGEKALYAQVYYWKREGLIGWIRHTDGESLLVVRRYLDTTEPQDANLRNRWLKYYASHITANTRGGEHNLISMAKVLTDIEAFQLGLKK